MSLLRRLDTDAERLQHELLCHLAISACGVADAPTLIFNTGRKQDEVEDALVRLVVEKDAERVGVAFRITDQGRNRISGGRS